MPKDSSEAETIPSWMNLEFLENVFKSDNIDEDFEIKSFDIKRATAAGDNYLSLIYRATVQITKRGQSENRSLIIKCQPAGEAIQKVTKNYELFEQEARMLKDVLPAMHKLLREANVENFSPFSAKLLYSHFSSTLQVIVLEDLKESGFEMLERTAGLDQEHCMMVMRKLAQFHAASLVLKEKNPELLETLIDPISEEMVEKEFDKFFMNLLTDLCGEIEKNNEELKIYIDKILKISERAAARWAEGRKRIEKEFSVLAHGDAWVNNMLFHYSKEDNQLLDMRLVDYQMSLWTSPGVDLQYFLNSSPAMDLLVDQTMFIEEYHTVLGETLSALGYQHLHITLDHLNQLFEKRGFFGMLSIFGIRNIVMVDDENIMDFDKIANQIDVSYKFSKIYMESLKIQVPLMEERGWLVTA
ncbi:hypothetical protein L9F63_022895 [Diploptera punctata]|uniref:CHK kinase-like domain-containing protein n=1 Tax=Diploptera punctata TaxID=6984 RepID=A0AAD7ZLS6_DIPPU|nr:hypothetical protein L9F63_022895 [Diploptera punctata]